MARHVQLGKDKSLFDFKYDKILVTEILVYFLPLYFFEVNLNQFDLNFPWVWKSPFFIYLRLLLFSFCVEKVWRKQGKGEIYGISMQEPWMKREKSWGSPIDKNK